MKNLCGTSSGISTILLYPDIILAMSKVLVTGGAGFIGSNLVDRLIELGHTVISIDNESATSNLQFYWNNKAENYKADITDFESICGFFEGVDYVFHTAAEARIQPSIENPFLTISTNIIGTVNVLQASRLAGVKRFIYSMTSSVYGNSNQIPLVETQASDCLTPYSVSKYTGEQLCRLYSNLYKLETASLRYFNVYGKREPTKGHYAPVVSKFITQHKAGDFLTIIGDGEQRRDFTHIDDVIDANILAMTCKKELYGEIFNIGAGRNFSINELAQMISTKYQYLPARPGEARETLANNTKAKEMLGWVPTRKLEDFIQESLSNN